MTEWEVKKVNSINRLNSKSFKRSVYRYSYLYRRLQKDNRLIGKLNMSVLLIDPLKD